MNDPNVILACGDWHGDANHLTYIFEVAVEEDVDVIVQVGDFGYWEHLDDGDFLDKCAEYADESGIPIYWVDGNHENHTMLRVVYGPGGARHNPTPEGFWEIRPGLYYIPRGTRWTWNGVKLMGLGGAYCVAPETKVLTTDLRWVDAGDLQVDDKLIAFDEDLNSAQGKNMQLRESKVEFTGRNVLPCYRIMTDRGETIVSSEHLMVWKSSPEDHRHKQWKEASELVPGNAVQWITTPWDVDTSRDAGYIAGILDGEGWIDHTRVAFGQNPGLVIDKSVNVLTTLGFNTSRHQQLEGRPCERVAIVGGKWESLRLLGSVRPERLLDKAALLWDGKEIIGKGKETQPGKAWATVLEVEYLGPREVVTLKTSTSTFIADGFAAHNSVDKDYRLERTRNHVRSVRYSDPDFVHRGEYALWWPEEEISDDELAYALDGDDVDVLFTHDKPKSSNPPWNRKAFPECLPNAEKVQQAVETLHVKKLIHGHLHFRYTDYVYNGTPDGYCRVDGLDCNAEADGNPDQSWVRMQLTELE